MRKRLNQIAPLLFAALMTASYVAAQKPAPAASPAPAKKALFWKATSGGHTAYLLGSIHLGSKEMYPLPKEIEDAFESSTALIVEFDVSHVDQQAMMAKVMQTGMYEGDDTLWDHISAENRQRLEKFCEKYGFPAAGMAKMKPWVVTMMVSILPMMKNGMDAGLGIDKYFLDKAAQSGKRIVELESADWQLKLLSGVTDKMLEQYLAATVDEDPAVEAKKLEDAWLSGDPVRVDRLMSEEMAKSPDELNRALLTDRNPHMADVAEEFLKGKGQGFMVVGAAHMVGKDGIVALLRKRGYKVEQVALAQ